MVKYTGQNSKTILSYVQSNGSLYGHLYNVHGNKVTTVSFENINGELLFKMAGKEFDSPTNALIALHSDLAMPTRGAVGSKEGTAGNAASDVIGQYRIFPHIKFGKVSLSDIVGSSERIWGGFSKSRKPKVSPSTKIKIRNTLLGDNRPAREVFFTKFDANVAKALRDKFGAELVRREFDILTQNEMELRYGL